MINLKEIECSNCGAVFTVDIIVSGDIEDGVTHCPVCGSEIDEEDDEDEDDYLFDDEEENEDDNAD